VRNTKTSAQRFSALCVIQKERTAVFSVVRDSNK
jgi:hypothetical protein